MKKYAILANPGHNRVYFESSKKLAISELTIALTKLACNTEHIEETYIQNIFYITFEIDSPFTKDNLLIISRLSFVYAMYEVFLMDDIQYLCPLLLPSYQNINNNISSILKYTGKTNELFTRMMINVGILSSSFKESDISILDPVAGKGTTLYEALVCGYHAYGIEIGEQVVTESYHYMKKFLELEKFKHTTAINKISGANKSFSAKKFSVEFSKDKEEYKNHKKTNWTMIAGNSMYANRYFKKNSFHLMVGDLPYGVQHGNVTVKKGGSITRNPKELIASCLDAWWEVLKPNGILVLAWNNFVLSREDFVDLLISHKFIVFNEGIYLEFEHRVDQSINRDIIVAKKSI